MTTETEAKKALDERAKALDAREQALDAREKALPGDPQPEDLTPVPTQAEIDALRRGGGKSATYKTRDAKAG